MRFPSKVDGWLIGVLAVPLGASALAAAGSGSAATWLIPALMAAVILPILLRTDYELTESALRIRCGFFRSSVPLDAILSVTPSTSPLSSPALSLDRLDVEHRGGHVLISPRDRDAFVAALRQRAPQVRWADTTPSVTRWSAAWKATFVGFAILVPSLIGGAVIVGGSREATVRIDPARVRVRGPMGAASFAPQDVVDVSWNRDTTEVARKVRGFAAFGWLRGRFHVDGLGDGYVFAEAGRPSVVVRTTDSFVIVGFHDEARTRRLYDDLNALRAGGQGMAGLLKRVDHLVYAVPDLDAAVADMERRLGVRAAPGGQHPGRGTRNAIIALGPDSYLEILAPDPAQAASPAPRWFGVDPQVPARLAGWAAKGADLTRLVASAAQRGVPLGPVVAGSRQRPDGVTLTWTLTDPGAANTVSLTPFFIDWAQSPHPAATAPRGPVLESLRAEHPRPDLAREPLAALSIDLPVESGARPALVAVLRTVSGVVELR